MKHIVFESNVKSREIDKLLHDKESLVEDLENYMKSMIYEFVIGKRSV